MPKILTRPVTASDLPDVCDMAHALAAHHGDHATLTLADLDRDMLGQSPWLRCLVAEHAGIRVGYAALVPLAQLQFGVRGMDLHHLFVRPEVRGQGVGRLLIDASIAEARALGCRYLTVGTDPKNAVAQQVYRAAGFDDLPPPGPRFRLKW
jgi:GNAT superfamily N-acetyltransferase